MKIYVISGLILMTALNMAYGGNVDPAPSGTETVVIDVYPDGPIISGPGKDAGSPTVREGNKEIVDFEHNTNIEKPISDNTTIIDHSK